MIWNNLLFLYLSRVHKLCNLRAEFFFKTNHIANCKTILLFVTFVGTSKKDGWYLYQSMFSKKHGFHLSRKFNVMFFTAFDWRRHKWYHVAHGKNGFFYLLHFLFRSFVCLFVCSIYISISWSSYDRMKATPTFFSFFNSCWECNSCCCSKKKIRSCLLWVIGWYRKLFLLKSAANILQFKTLARFWW